MPEVTRFEKIADDFIEAYLRDHPVMIYSLDTELEEYVENIEELKNNATADEILKEYLKSKKKKAIDEEINNELINAGDKIRKNEERLLNASYNLSDHYSDEESPDTTLLQYIQSPANLVIYELMQLVVRSDKIRIRTMHELEDTEQEDPT